MTQVIFKSACNPWNPGNHSTWGKLFLGFVQIIDRSWNRGWVLLVGDQWSFKKNQTQKLNRGLRWFITRKLLPSTLSNNFWATFRKRDLDFFVFKSASESPFYQVGEQENPPGSYWTSMSGDLLTFHISAFVHTQSLLNTFVFLQGYSNAYNTYKQVFVW